MWLDVLIDRLFQTENDISGQFETTLKLNLYVQRNRIHTCILFLKISTKTNGIH